MYEREKEAERERIAERGRERKRETPADPIWEATAVTQVSSRGRRITV